jgi:myo-inositol-1(or 4)-monophosphatase
VSGSDLARLLEVAGIAARAGAAVVAESRGGHQVGHKGPPGDYVTEVDRASEAAILEVLRAEAGDVAILAEEGGGETADRFWAVDPLDGTTNFLHGYPVVGVSVGFVHRGRAVLGVVEAPLLGTTHLGAEGLGAERRRPGEPSRPLRVSERPPEEAVVATGFPFRRKDRLPRYLSMLRGCLERFEDLRRPGAAALDLAWTAEGAFDGFFELGLGRWDVAAGAALIVEAGGRVSDWAGGPEYLSGHILAGPPQVHEVLVDVARASASSRPG